MSLSIIQSNLNLISAVLKLPFESSSNCLASRISNGSVKLSLLIALSGLDVIEAKQLLNDSKGNLRTALITVMSD